MPTPRKPPVRRAHVVCWPLPGEPVKPGVLTLTVGALDTVYRFLPLETALGRAWRLEKATPGSDPSELAYDVLLAADGRHQCGCKGFCRHGRCKHVDSLSALVKLGTI
jgi:hypothetical protein